MYFPYLRGRQYELIALRELLENDTLSKRVVPIIEPVKLSSTLINTL
ncbi:sce7725 family protein, partial [Streptococcus suis]